MRTSKQTFHRREAVLSLLSFWGLIASVASTLITPAPITNNLNSAQTVFFTCALPRKLSSDLWEELKIDHYIKNYPNGQTISVKDFARQNGAENFLCGIGEKCNAGELCHPVQGLAWYVLFATQEFNLYMNSLYKAVGTTMDLVRETTASLIIDITKPPPNHRKRIIWIETLGFLSAITISLTMGLFVNFATLAVDSAWISVAKIAGWLGVGSSIGIAGLSLDSLVSKSAKKGERTTFGNWAQFAFYFSECESHMHKAISKVLTSTLNTGISSSEPNSLATILSSGSFVDPRARRNLPELEAKMKDVTKIRALVILLRSMNAFITRGSEPCTGPGINGARDEDEHLSFCGQDNVMMNIIIAEGDKVINEIYHARSFATKYSITTEYLTMSSWECQKKHGVNFDPYQYSALPTSPSAECLANLPVCDCTQDSVKLEMKRSNIVKACREVDKLPI